MPTLHDVLLTDAVPLHEVCGRVEASMASRCLLCRKPGSDDRPVRLFYSGDDWPAALHEACAPGGVESLPDGTTRTRCAICRRWASDMPPYDLGRGEIATMHPDCARKIGASTSDAFRVGVAGGVGLAALAAIVRRVS